jgi:hypothetical protein
VQWQSRGVSYGPYDYGTFSEPYHFWVRVTDLKELRYSKHLYGDRNEVGALEGHLNKLGYLDVSDQRKLTKADWSKALSGTYNEATTTPAYRTVPEDVYDKAIEKANQFTEAISRGLSYARPGQYDKNEDADWERFWSDIPGVYALAKNGESFKFIVNGYAHVPPLWPVSPEVVQAEPSAPKAQYKPSTEPADFAPTHQDQYDDEHLVMAGPIDPSGHIHYVDSRNGKLVKLTQAEFESDFMPYTIPTPKELVESIEYDIDPDMNTLFRLWRGADEVFSTLFEDTKYRVLRNVVNWNDVLAALKPTLRKLIVEGLEADSSSTDAIIVRGPPPEQIGLDFPAGMVPSADLIVQEWTTFIANEGLGGVGTEVVTGIFGGEHYGSAKSTAIWKRAINKLYSAEWLEGGFLGIVLMRPDFVREPKFFEKMPPYLRDWIEVDLKDAEVGEAVTPQEALAEFGPEMFDRNIRLVNVTELLSDFGDEDWAALLLGE